MYLKLKNNDDFIVHNSGLVLFVWYFFKPGSCEYIIYEFFFIFIHFNRIMIPTEHARVVAHE